MTIDTLSTQRIPNPRHDTTLSALSTGTGTRKTVFGHLSAWRAKIYFGDLASFTLQMYMDSFKHIHQSAILIVLIT